MRDSRLEDVENLCDSPWKGKAWIKFVIFQALNFVLEEAKHFSSGKEHLCEENSIFYLKFAKGITAKAQCTTAIAGV